MLAIALGVGLLIGITLGALGGGGSVLAVPALIYLLGQTTHQATTASLVIVGVAAIAGLVVHARAGHVRWRAGLGFGVAGVVGSALGSLLAARLPENWLLIGFAVLMAIAAVTMWRGSGSGEKPAPEEAPDSAGDGSEAVTRKRSWWRVVGAGSAVGLLTGLFGVGGGFLAVPGLLFALGLDMATAVGTSLAVITLNSASALLTHLGSAAPDWGIVTPFVATAVVGTLAGQRLADRLSNTTLQRGFAALLVALAAFVLVDQLVLR